MWVFATSFHDDDDGPEPPAPVENQVVQTGFLNEETLFFFLK